MVVAALAANTDIAAAKARLSQARAMLGEYVADQGPSGSVGGGYSRSRPSFAQFGIGSFPGIDLKDFDLYQANFDASWELDLFGGQRRAVEAALGAAKAASADVEDVRLSVAAETAEAYLELRNQQSRLQLLTRSAGIDAQLIQLTESRQVEGTASALDLERIRAQQEATLGRNTRREGRHHAATGPAGHLDRPRTRRGGRRIESAGGFTAAPPRRFVSAILRDCSDAAPISARRNRGWHPRPLGSASPPLICSRK